MPPPSATERSRTSSCLVRILLVNALQGYFWLREYRSLRHLGDFCGLGELGEDYVNPVVARFVGGGRKAAGVSVSVDPISTARRAGRSRQRPVGKGGGEVAR